MLPSLSCKSLKCLSHIQYDGPVAASPTDNIFYIWKLTGNLAADYDCAFRPSNFGNRKDMPAYPACRFTTRMVVRWAVIDGWGEQVGVDQEISEVGICPVKYQRRPREKLFMSVCDWIIWTFFMIIFLTGILWGWYIMARTVRSIFEVAAAQYWQPRASHLGIPFLLSSPREEIKHEHCLSKVKLQFYMDLVKGIQGILLYWL